MKDITQCLLNIVELSKKTSMNKIGKIAHNILVRNTSQNDFIKIEITPSVFNIFSRTFWNRLRIAFQAYFGQQLTLGINVIT